MANVTLYDCNRGTIRLATTLASFGNTPKTKTKKKKKKKKKFSRFFGNTTYHSLVTSILRARQSKRRNVGGAKTVPFTARTSSCETIKATSTTSSASIVTMIWTFTTSRFDSKRHFKRKGNPRVESSRSLLQNA